MPAEYQHRLDRLPKRIELPQVKSKLLKLPELKYTCENDLNFHPHNTCLCEVKDP